MSVDENTDSEFFELEADNDIVNGYYDMLNNRIHLTNGYNHLNDGSTYKIISRCGKKFKVEVDLNKRYMKVLGVYEQGKFIPKKRANEPNNKLTLDLVCLEHD